MPGRSTRRAGPRRAGIARGHRRLRNDASSTSPARRPAVVPSRLPSRAGVAKPSRRRRLAPRPRRPGKTRACMRRIPSIASGSRDGARAGTGCVRKQAPPADRRRRPCGDRRRGHSLPHQGHRVCGRSDWRRVPRSESPSRRAGGIVAGGHAGKVAKPGGEGHGAGRCPARVNRSGSS